MGKESVAMKPHLNEGDQKLANHLTAMTHFSGGTLLG
jgi:hypothetical protein